MWQAKHIEAVAAALGVDPRELLPGPPPATRANPALVLEAGERDLVEAIRAGDVAGALRRIAELLEVAAAGGGR